VPSGEARTPVALAVGVEFIDLGGEQPASSRSVNASSRRPRSSISSAAARRLKTLAALRLTTSCKYVFTHSSRLFNSP
jgi:hypothetical protein